MDSNEIIKELGVVKWHLSDDLGNPNSPEVIEDGINLIEKLIADKAAIKAKLIDIADRIATVRDWTEIPEETEAGINGNIDDLNDLIEEIGS